MKGMGLDEGQRVARKNGRTKNEPRRHLYERIVDTRPRSSVVVNGGVPVWSGTACLVPLIYKHNGGERYSAYCHHEMGSRRRSENGETYNEVPLSDNLTHGPCNFDHKVQFRCRARNPKSLFYSNLSMANSCPHLVPPGRPPRIARVFLENSPDHTSGQGNFFTSSTEMEPRR